VLALDRDLSALSWLRHPSLEKVEADLEQSEGWPLGERTFDAVVVTNYLWRSIFDDLVGAVRDDGVLIYETFAEGNERYGRPRRPEPEPGGAGGDDGGAALDVVHLNGLAGAAAEELTFSTMQYASRLCNKDHEYERLVSDLERAPFVFAGTTRDEVVLWQHVERRRRATGDPPPRRPSFLISPSLTRARQVLLESLGIRWVRSRIEALPDEIWCYSSPALALGYDGGASAVAASGSAASRQVR
jgi:hypothetical protein